jgi:hypothetical protein
MSTDEYYSTKQLKGRGWTERLIRTFLGGPDKRISNPYFSQGHEKHLYLVSRVIQAESGPSFTKDHAAARKVSACIRGAVDRKREELERLVSMITLPPLTLPEKELIGQAAVVLQTGPVQGLHSESHVALNILLDTMKSLEWHLDPFMWHPGIRHARKLLRGRMLAHIIDHYPALAAAARERGEQDNGDPGEW